MSRHGNRQGTGQKSRSRKGSLGGSPTRSGDGAAQERAGTGAPVAIGDEVTVDVIGISHEGEGVGRFEGFTLFVPSVLPGEQARVRVSEVRKQFGKAQLLQRLSSSEDRVQPPCPVYDACGGCQLQHLSYEAQLRWKRQTVIDALKRIGKLNVIEAQDKQGGGGAEETASAGDGVIVHPVIGMAEPWRYRNKIHVPIGSDEEGGLIGGFYAPGTHEIADMDACLITSSRGDEAVARVKSIARRFGISPYNESTHQGLLRHVVVREGAASGELMIVLVTNGERIPRTDELIEAIRTEVPGLTSLCQNVNTDRTNLIFGARTLTLWGREVIYDTIGDVRFAISARSFYQVNPVQTEKLYGTAVEYAGLTGKETVIDAYCGIGTISLFLARRAKQVFGVEIVEEAVADARLNAELNGIRNAEFAAGRAEDVLPRWKARGIAADVIVVDPPRKGCERSLLDTLLEMRPERIVYVSCSPSTLARDLRRLEDGGYRTVHVQPLDMFPHTTHVECSVLLVRS